MTASLFLIANALIILFVVLRIISYANSRGRPSVRGPGESKQEPRGFRMEIFDIFTGAKPQEKSLNCTFQFNGQNYDAYEVLGVPAGAPKELCFGAFRDLSRTASGNQKKLLEAAIKALEKHRFS